MFRISLVLFTAVAVPFCLSQETLRFNRADLTVLGVTIGESSQEQVLAKLGRAPLFRVGTGEGSDDAVCYRSGAQTDDTVVIFHFGGLGGWTDVTKISISRGKPPSLRGVTCPPNKAVSHELTFFCGAFALECRQPPCRRPSAVLRTLAKIGFRITFLTLVNPKNQSA